MESNSPFFSIITISLNAETSIGNTMKSILRQSFNDYEVIVKDGGSTDNTLNRVPKDSRIHCYQSGDSGLYDAMNQAIQYANGKYLIFMNCGDLFYDENVLERIFGITRLLKVPSVVYGDAYFVTENRTRKAPKVVTDYYWSKATLCHQAVFFPNLKNKELFYHKEYKIAADFELLMRLYKEGIPFIYADMIICKYEGGGISETEKGLNANRKEKKQILYRYYRKHTLLIYYCIRGYNHFKRNIIGTFDLRLLQKK